MRDSEIYAMNEANGKRSELIMRQFSFLKNRQEAFERVLKTASLKMRFRYFWNIELFFRVWDEVTSHLLKEDEKAIEELAKKPKLSVVRGMGRNA